MQYLYVNEDGAMSQTTGQEPSQEDLQSVNDEVLDIIRFRGNQFEKAKVEPNDDDEEKLDVTWEKV